MCACAHTKVNVAIADELVLSHEDKTQIHHSTHPAAQFAVVWIILSRQCWLAATFTEGLTEAVSYATLSSSKQLLNYVIFIWFTDKNLFTLATMKNPRINQLYSSVTTKKKHIGAKRYLSTRMTFSHSPMVPVSVSKFTTLVHIT